MSDQIWFKFELQVPYSPDPDHSTSMAFPALITRHSSSSRTLISLLLLLGLLITLSAGAPLGDWSEDDDFDGLNTFAFQKRRARELFGKRSSPPAGPFWMVQVP